eukprot:scaffold124827_cov63-Phaeocystis_antarctica.AAC.1
MALHPRGSPPGAIAELPPARARFFSVSDRNPSHHSSRSESHLRSLSPPSGISFGLPLSCNGMMPFVPLAGLEGLLFFGDADFFEDDSHASNPSSQVCSLPGSTGVALHTPSQEPPELQQFLTPAAFSPHVGQLAASGTASFQASSSGVAAWPSEASASSSPSSSPPPPLSFQAASAAASAAAMASFFGSSPRLPSQAPFCTWATSTTAALARASGATTAAPGSAAASTECVLGCTV